MRKIFSSVIALVFIVPLLAKASLPVVVSTDELVENTDHLFVGHIVGVDMVNDQGRQLTDPTERTGPGSKNVIRLIVDIDEVIISPAKKVPETIKVPLDSFMHYSLGQIKKVHEGKSEKFLLLLKGKDFQPPFPGVFGRGLEEGEVIVNLMKNKPAQ